LGYGECSLYIEQGLFTNEPSASLIRVDLEISADRISQLMAGGSAKTMREVLVRVGD
jgi:hypothetical protein